MSRDAIHAFAEEVATYLLVRADAADLPVDLDKVGAYLGVREVKYEAIAAEGYVEQFADAGYRIVLRSGRSPQRTRFSFAHELGHVVVHKIRGTRDSSFGRRYRAYTSVSSGVDEEAIADAIAGALLLPPSAVARVLPNRFSIRRVVRLSELTTSSIPTALIRAMWYATQPCFAFHLRWFSGKFADLRCMWVQSSRSFRQITNERAIDLIEPARIKDLLDRSRGAKFVEEQRPDGPLSHIQMCRSNYFERQSLYGIAFLKPNWEETLFDEENVNEQCNAIPDDIETNEAAASAQAY